MITALPAGAGPATPRSSVVRGPSGYRTVMKDEEELLEEARRSRAETERLREESGLADDGEAEDPDTDQPDDDSS